MARQLAFMILTALLALPASASRGRAVAPVIGDTLSIIFVDGTAADGAFMAAGGEAWLDMKGVSHNASGREHGTHVLRRFGVRVVRTSGSASGTGTVTITARIESSDGRTSIRLDGRPLTELPTIVDAHAAIGAVGFHIIEIEISDAVAPGPVATTVTWEVNAQ
ncbi:MAG TPA: hypothetical protein VLC46_10600 [Thermoanaerobaculia bacterium]|nr:hypothetical protein [Thermoanaerobaculia bacterium]